jgi:hypothetical protein
VTGGSRKLEGGTPLNSSGIERRHMYFLGCLNLKLGGDRNEKYIRKVGSIGKMSPPWWVFTSTNKYLQLSLLGH